MYELWKILTAALLTLPPSMQSAHLFYHAKNYPKHSKLLTKERMRCDQPAGAQAVQGPFLLVAVRRPQPHPPVVRTLIWLQLRSVI